MLLFSRRLGFNVTSGLVNQMKIRNENLATTQKAVTDKL